MVLGWRRAFCTSIPRESSDSTAVDSIEEVEYERDNGNSCGTTPKFARRFGFFGSSSNPSTPPLRSDESVSSPTLRCRTTATVPAPSSSVPVSPKLQCRTKNSPRFFTRTSTPSSPRSPSPFNFLRSSLRLTTRRCGLCLQSMKRGQGMATFTAECSHNFHFPCIADHVKKQGSLACPVCNSLWKEMPLLSIHEQNQKHQLIEEEDKTREKLATRFFMEDVNESPRKQPLRSDLKVYNDDEPLASLTPKARFIAIPESDETCDEESIDEFQGFYVNGGNGSNNPIDDHSRDVDVQLLPEAAVIAGSRRHETYAIVLKVKAPAIPEKTQRRAPIDLVTVIDVSGKMTTEKLQIIKRAMRQTISSLSSKDRLSIVAFSSYSKRLLPLRRMTTSGRRSARRIIESMAVLEGSSNSKDAVKKAVKVLEDRREKNPVSTIILLSEFNQSSSVTSTRYSHSHSHSQIPIHSLKLAVTEDHEFAKCIGNLLKVFVQDLQLQLGFISGTATIAGVYSHTPQPTVLGSGAVRNLRIGELSADEERELLIELKVPSSRSHQILSVQCCYKESTSQEIIYGKQQSLLVPRPNTVRSSSPSIQRLRNLFITTRALAESRRLIDRNDLTGAYHMLISARALMNQSNPVTGNEFMIGLEAEIWEVQRRRKAQVPVQVAAYTDEKGEPLTPTSAWRVADRLAKVAMMRKSVNRVSDLHGFEDARF